MRHFQKILIANVTAVPGTTINYHHEAGLGILHLTEIGARV